MDNPHSPCSCGMDTLVPLDLSTRKSVDMSVVPRRPLGVWSGGAVKEVKLEVTESESGGEKGVCKDQACLPLRKRRYPPPPEEEGPPAWKYYATYMAVALPPIPEHYQGTATYLPSALPLYPASALLGVAPHPAMLPPDTQLQADITAAARQDEDGDTPMHISVVQGNILAAQRVISLLLHGGRHLDSLNNLRQTPLHLAVITEQPTLVSLLLTHGSSPHIPDRNGQTCVHLACEYGSVQSLGVLLRGGGWDLEARNYQGMTALHVAVSSGRSDVTLCMLENGADVDAVDIKSGRSPLIQAVEGGCEKLLLLLLQRGAHVNAQTYAGNTALHVASGRGLEEITRILLRRGADRSIKNCHNDTAVMVSKDRRIADILRGKSSSAPTQKEKFRGDMRDSSVTPPSRDVTPRDSSVTPPSRDVTPRDSSMTPRDEETPRESSVTPRDEKRHPQTTP